ncbi:putative delta-12 desaturase [Aureobasidium pullulans]|uniref:Putative delta-12 desaturase n=1 Tax=Aureobasidium pullulans TaxID=5580 RepID=A0A4S8ZWG1_AURPU|nr:putative delta-12 desaturase [Aureobasidium pullulans]
MFNPGWPEARISSSFCTPHIIMYKPTGDVSPPGEVTCVSQRRSRHIDLNGNDFEVPAFTMTDVRNAIPKHCFYRSTTRGLAYVLRDLYYLGLTTYCILTYTPLLANRLQRLVVYAFGTALSGVIMTGIWILAHECGHGAFSERKLVNNLVGLFLHSFLLVPYHSWRICHSQHHKSTSNLEKDNVFVPYTRDAWVKHNYGHDSDPHSIRFAHLTEDSPILTLYYCLLHQILGWPAYMLVNMSGQQAKRGFPYGSHFYFGAQSTLFKEQELPMVLLSDLGVIAMLSLLALCSYMYGWWSVVVFYLIPYLWLNHWVVLITYLQHTDARLPHYGNAQWTFARGAAATIDRDFGFIDTHFFHNIVSTHVCHHMASEIPFYHAKEATVAIRKVMGRHYHVDNDTPLLKAFWITQRDCQFVEETHGADGSGVFLYRNLHGRGASLRNLS